jgi:hypothetical protein
VLEVAWSSERVRQLFNERILPELCPGRRLRRAEPKRMTHEPGRSCVVLYRLFAEEDAPPGAPPVPPLATLSFSDGDDSLEGGARHYAEPPPGAPTGEPRPGALLLPDLRALVELFPLDWRLPGLRLAADLGRMAPLLDRLAPPGERRADAGWSCVPLRYHPRTRCVLLYERDAAPPRRVVGKLYARRKRAERAWETLGALHAAGFRARLWRSPAPLHREGAAHLVLMEWLPGEPLRDRLAGAGGDVSRRLVRLAAQALAELHRSDGAGFERRSAEADREKIRRRAEQVGWLDPGLAEGIGRLLDALEDRAPELRAPRATLLHGSASPNQLLVDAERLSIVDLDGVRRGDPAIDVGSFMASLVKVPARGDGGRNLEALAELFLEEYRARSPEDADLARRARAIECQEIVNQVARGRLKRASLPGSPASAGDAGRALERAARCLAAL